MVLTVASTVAAYCFVDGGDSNHLSTVVNSTLTATVIQDLHGAVPPLSLVGD